MTEMTEFGLLFFWGGGFVFFVFHFLLDLNPQNNYFFSFFKMSLN